MMKIMVKSLPWITEAVTRFVPEVFRGKGALSSVPITLSFCSLATPFNIGLFFGAVKFNSLGSEYTKIIIIVGKMFSAAILDNILINNI
jgi:hypothetical protein